MLLRMYVRWAEKKGYRVQILDKLAGTEAGIKSAVVKIEGRGAFGWLKGETGVHRLIRISPFDADKARHTSFALVNVIPEITADTDIKISESDLKIETFRSSGPGGQSVNTTDSAVRITHLPTGIVVSCQTERSQLQNKLTAMAILKSKLAQLEAEKIAQKIDSIKAKEKAMWGNQIRTYVLHPYKQVRDHRTGIKVSDAEKVLDGEIDKFLEAQLRLDKKGDKE